MTVRPDLAPALPTRPAGPGAGSDQPAIGLADRRSGSGSAHLDGAADHDAHQPLAGYSALSAQVTGTACPNASDTP